ncbi:hypothetical protein HDU97_005299 [Phlyctochytrium planicorne]|nr:hypothetical protein HDU97_005299 [Phlyctochytrium planicorne]
MAVSNKVLAFGTGRDTPKVIAYAAIGVSFVATVFWFATMCLAAAFKDGKVWSKYAEVTLKPSLGFFLSILAWLCSGAAVGGSVLIMQQNGQTLKNPANPYPQQPPYAGNPDAAYPQQSQQYAPQPHYAPQSQYYAHQLQQYENHGQPQHYGDSNGAYTQQPQSAQPHQY